MHLHVVIPSLWQSQITFLVIWAEKLWNYLIFFISSYKRFRHMVNLHRPRCVWYQISCRPMSVTAEHRLTLSLSLNRDLNPLVKLWFAQWCFRYSVCSVTFRLWSELVGWLDSCFTNHQSDVSLESKHLARVWNDVCHCQANHVSQSKKRNIHWIKTV